ncbi:hypothetical protein BV22DRAFT_1029249 [Leucogyrophana mollusca]|uniref:Uncharacterized protein n=1 Tax=Leucogyrophana mollusca TaxID=85980 RepID=A0ACB8BUN2_9AGAM|nr:hypothetical protein BV22DRAFT_1029249 [Leucogyrophana mollusca]
MLALRFLLSAAFLAVSAVGQAVSIQSPAPGTTVAPGANITVQLGTTDSLTNVVHETVVIGIQSCPGGNCFPTSEGLGQILYQGSYNPQFGSGSDDLYEDFSVQIPASIAAGEAQLGVAHFYLIGAGFWPILQVINETIYIS